MARFMRSDLGLGHSRLSRPAVIGEELVLTAEPVRIFFRIAVQFRPIRIKSALRAPLPEEAPVPPPPPSDENLAPNIYGYGAM